jgi:uncharacterized SAM-binding protein YcdF (DUF218 family)
MFYFLSKTFDFLVMPLSIVFLLLICALSVRNVQKKRRFVFFAFLWLSLISNEYLVNKAFLWWEPRPVAVREVRETYDVGVVLSGGLISLGALDSTRVELGEHANRFYSAYRLYKAGKVRKILLTGASPLYRSKVGLGETQLAASILRSWGVPKVDILLEQEAQNTRQNAAFSADILKNTFENPKVLLITSAFHMPRAIRCFEKAGIKPDSFPCDFYGRKRSILWIDMIIPNGDFISDLNLLWHEWIGFIAYWIAGYI